MQKNKLNSIKKSAAKILKYIFRKEYSKLTGSSYIDIPNVLNQNS